MVKLTSEAGLSQSDFIPEDPDGDNGKKKRKTAARGKKNPFGELAPWVKKCAAALKIKHPEKVFFPCAGAEEIKKLETKVSRWIHLSQPVLVVRENDFLPGTTSSRWPLHIAIIDGLGSDAESFHVVFPGGKDRGLRTGGEMKLSELLEHTTNAVMMFYRPGQK